MNNNKLALVSAQLARTGLAHVQQSHEPVLSTPNKTGMNTLQLAALASLTGDQHTLDYVVNRQPPDINLATTTPEYIQSLKDKAQAKRDRKATIRFYSNPIKIKKAINDAAMAS